MNKNEIKRYLQMTLGVLISASSTRFFLIPTGISTGGVSGIGVVINELFNIPVSVSVWGFNILFLLLAGVFLGKEIFYKSLYGTLVFSLFVSILPHWDFTNGDLLMAVLAGGIMSGTGFGILFLAGGSTGGTSLPPYFMKKYLHIPLTTGFLLSDAMSVGMNIFIGKAHYIVYALFTLILIKVVADYVGMGLTRKQAVYIVSDAFDVINTYIHNDLNRGTTNIYVETGYLKNNQKMILTIIPARDVFALKEHVKSLDPYALIMIATVSEIEGRGFSLEQKLL